MKAINALVCFVLAISLTACGTLGVEHMDAGVVGQQLQTRTAKVIDIKPVSVRSKTSYSVKALGATTGGALGAAIGNKVGRGKGQQLATLLGGMIGTAAGSAAMENGSDRGTQLILSTSSGTEAVVMTANIDPRIRAGDMVRLVYLGGRVTNVYKL